MRGGDEMSDHAIPHPRPTRPRLRGRLHQIAFLVSLPAGAALLVAAGSGRARLAAPVYVLIAGSWTPVILLALRPGWRAAFLALVWTVAAAGIVLVLLRTANPVVGLTRMILYLGLGWISALPLPHLVGTT